MSGPVMESKVTEDLHTSPISSSDAVHHLEEKIPNHPNHEEMESKLDASPEEIRTILEVIAATGKFWHDWDMLKYMLSFQLKQVLGEYPEAQMASSIELQQSYLSALLSFIEGPPFTLQRLCEILLNPKSTYRSLSKLALALEKNLLVTSTLTMCTDPYPSTPTKKPAEPNDPLQDAPNCNEGTPNGVGNANNDLDEEMVDAEADEDLASKDTEMKEDKESAGNLESNSDPTLPFGEPSTSTEHYKSSL